MAKTVGEFQLTEKIGKGSFAEVYLGVSIADGKKYAVKVISKELIYSEPKLAQGLDSEIRIMQDFVHPHIIHLHKHFSSEKNVYLVLDFCQGGDLSRFVRKRGRLPEPVAMRFLQQIAYGLSFLKEKNFIHRDLKPANVLLTEFSENATIKLADFGFARFLGAAALAQTRCGTPLYMAPEILEAKDYDAKADIWSLGCIFFEMLVGTPPFRGQNEMDLLRNIRSKDLRIPDDIGISRVAMDLMAKLLEREASRRSSVEQLMQVVAHLSSLSTAANSASFAPPGTPSPSSSSSTPTTFAPISSSPTSAATSTAPTVPFSPPPTPSPLLSGRQSQGRRPSTDERRLETTPGAPPEQSTGLRFSPRAAEDRLMRDDREGDPHSADDDFIFIEYGARKGSFQSAAPGAPSLSAPPALPGTAEAAGSGAAEESQATSADADLMVSNLAHTCSTFCELFNAMINVADRQIAKDPPSLTFFRSRADDPPPSFPNPHESLRGCLRACALYLHSLELFRSFVKLLDPHTFVVESSQIQIFKQDLLGVFDRIIERAERCERLAALIVAATPNNQFARAVVPKPEAVLLEEANSLETEARVKKQLGDFDRARYLFMFSVRLLRGITLTVPESENRGVANDVKNQCDRMEEEMKECEERMQRHGMQIRPAHTPL